MSEQLRRLRHWPFLPIDLSWPSFPLGIYILKLASADVTVGSQTRLGQGGENRAHSAATGNTDPDSALMKSDHQLRKCTGDHNEKHPLQPTSLREPAQSKCTSNLERHECAVTGSEIAAQASEHP